MAGDFTKPTVNSTYVNFPVEIRDMFADQAKMFDGVSTTNYPSGAIKWSDANSRWEKYNGSTWGVLKAKYLIDVDTVDGYHAGNGGGAIPVSNGTVNTNLNADMVDGYNAGTSSGQVPISNGTTCVNLSADMLDGYHASNGAGNLPISNGTVNSNLNADMLDGYHAASFALLSGANFTARTTVRSDTQTNYGNAAFENICYSGDVYISWHAAGASAAVLKHTRGVAGLYCLDASNNNAPLYASDFQIPSDAKLKQDFQLIDDPLGIVDRLQGQFFTYKSDGRRALGFVANQVREVLPEVVSDGGGYLTMTHGPITAVHNEAIKILAARLAAVEARV